MQNALHRNVTKTTWIVLHFELNSRDYAVALKCRGMALDYKSISFSHHCISSLRIAEDRARDTGEIQGMEL